MNNKFLLILGIILFANVTIADNKSYGPIIQIQGQQIKELQKQVMELEKITSDLNVLLKKENSTDTVAIVDEPKLEAPKLSDKEEYDIALATLKEGDLSDAEIKFSEFIANHPLSQLQSNATFWYAETFYRRDMFDMAAINYLQSYKKHPKGSKASDALLKLSYSLAVLNKTQEACSMLKKLESEFPNRSIDSIKRTNEAKSNFYCKY